MGIQFLSIREVCERTAMNKQQIYRLIKQGRFPKPCPLGAQRRVAWVEKEVDDFCGECLAARERGDGEAERRARAVNARAAGLRER